MTYFNRNSESKHALILCPKHYIHSMGEVSLSNRVSFRPKVILPLSQSYLDQGWVEIHSGTSRLFGPNFMPNLHPRDKLDCSTCKLVINNHLLQVLTISFAGTCFGWRLVQQFTQIFKIWIGRVGWSIAKIEQFWFHERWSAWRFFVFGTSSKLALFLGSVWCSNSLGSGCSTRIKIRRSWVQIPSGAGFFLLSIFYYILTPVECP